MPDINSAEVKIGPVPPEIVKISDDEIFEALKEGKIQNLTHQIDLSVEEAKRLVNPNELMFLPTTQRQKMEQLDKEAEQAAQEAKKEIQEVLNPDPEIVKQVKIDLQEVEANIKRAEDSLDKAKKKKDRAKEAQLKNQLRILTQRKKTLESRL